MVRGYTAKVYCEKAFDVDSKATTTLADDSLTYTSAATFYIQFNNAASSGAICLRIAR